jgi:hypothetical protein
MLRLLTIASFVCLVGVFILWVRSYRHSDQISWRATHGYRGILTAKGDVELDVLWVDWSMNPEVFHTPRLQSDPPRPPVNYLRMLGGNTGDVYSKWEAAGFAWHQIHNPRHGTTHVFAYAPFWSFALLTAALPSAWIARRLRDRHRRARERRNAGLCPACGYDLRATPDRCPECGAMAEAIASSGDPVPDALR